MKYENKVTKFPKHLLIVLRMQPFPSNKPIKKIKFSTRFMVTNLWGNFIGQRVQSFAFKLMYFMSLQLLDIKDAKSSVYWMLIYVLSIF